MPPSYPQGHLQEPIDRHARHAQEFLAKRTHTERLGDRIASFIGSLTYVGLHVIVCAVWILWNTLPFMSSPHFDPAPFSLLDLVLAFEAILVASFILMRQSRMSRRSEERDQLMLQVLLLSEREITAVLGMERRIAEHIGLKEIAQDQEISELSQQTSIDEVAQIIQETLPTEKI